MKQLLALFVLCSTSIHCATISRAETDRIISYTRTETVNGVLIEETATYLKTEKSYISHTSRYSRELSFGLDRSGYLTGQEAQLSFNALRGKYFQQKQAL